MDENYDVNTRIVDFKTPGQLNELLDIELNWEAKGLNGVLGELDTVMKYR